MMRRKYLLLFIFLLFLPATIFAADLVNINTADQAALETLSGIGPSKAQAIITYRTNNGPFATIEDIMNVSGIGTATFNGIKDYITVSDAAQTQPAPTEASGTQTSSSITQIQTVVSGGGNGPPPITAQVTAETTTVAGAGTRFSGEAFGTKGEPLTGARYLWNFGDGATSEGKDTLHTYIYPGVYDVVLSVGYNYSSATARVAVIAKRPQVALVLEPDNSLLLVNNSAQELAVGGWSLISGEHSFVIPEDTRVRAAGGIRFAPAIMGFAAERGATLRFPNNTTAAVSTIASDSPLRGEPVSFVASPQATVKAPPQKVPAAKAVDQSAAVATSPVSREVTWSYFVGLAAVIALGAVGTYYAPIKRKGAETRL